MAISKNLVVSIKEDKAKLNEKMFIYRNDTGVDMYIELSNFKYSIGDEIVTGKLDVAYISAVFKNPSEEVFVKNNIPLVDGKIKFSFTKDVVDNMQEIGQYELQFQLFDRLTNRLTLPSYFFEVKEPIGQTEVEITEGMVDYSLTDFCTVVDDEVVLFAIEDGYIKTNWKAGDLITASRLNNIENGISANKEYIEEVKINNVKYENETLVYYNGDNWNELDVGSGTLDEDIVVAGVTVGNLTSGTVLNEGMNVIDVLKQMLIKVIPATYTKPTVRISSSVTSIETGSSISPRLTVTFVQNDGGAVTATSIKEGNTVLANSFTFTVPTFIITGDKTYTGTVSYGDGAIKNNNIGKPSPDGQIKAGTISANTTIKAYRPYFGYASDSGVVPTSDTIRKQTIKGLNLGNGGTIKVTTEPTSRLVCFAYPATLRDCTKIRYEDLNDDGNKSAFTSILLNIADASGGNSISYRVYYYISPIAFGLNATFTLTV